MNDTKRRQRGSALVLVVFLGMALLTLTLVSLEISRAQAIGQRGHQDAFGATEIARSASAQALAKIKYAGILEPHSGTGTQPSWVSFSGGQYYYYTVYDSDNTASTIRAWGRIPANETTTRSSSTVAPDDTTFDDAGWIVRGVEIAVQSTKYIPTSPGYFGNGGIEAPTGGFLWDPSVDPVDPSTWMPVTSSPSSYQDSDVPLQVSALDHPYDYLYNGGSPASALTHPHPFQLWVSQNPIGQYNTAAWFANSAGSGDPLDNVSPDPAVDYPTDPQSESHAYPVHSDVADVSAFGFDLWNTYKNDTDAYKLSSGSHSGTYGDLGDPSIVFVTGDLSVNSGDTFRGTGILVIRDDYDPNVDSDNTPSTRAGMRVSGTFEWTGLVIITGWAPSITVENGGDFTVVGSLLGEDSVQSGSEISLDSATIVLRVHDDMRLLYSSALFQPGGLIHDFLPNVRKTVVGARQLGHETMKAGGMREKETP